MIEPNETESKETLDHAIKVLRYLYSLIKDDPQQLLDAPISTPVKRVDDVMAARNPILKDRESE